MYINRFETICIFTLVLFYVIPVIFVSMEMSPAMDREGQL